MIISHKFKAIFVKTYKTAGTSVEAFMSRFCGPADVVTPIAPLVEGHVVRNPDGFYNHMPAHMIREKVGESCWREYRTFCVERNPWDKTISWYYMFKNSPLHGCDSSLSLDECLESGRIQENWPLYMDALGEEVIVNKVLRFESFADDLGSVFGELGIPFAGSLGINAKSEWRTDRRHYRDILTDAQAERIGRLFSKEIALHGYRY